VKEPDVITESHSPAAPPTPPVFGRDGEPCPACGAPLAGDQRYCLHCGARRPEARLEFLDVLDEDVRARRAAAAPGLAPAALAAPTPVGGVGGRLNQHAGLLAVGALLVLMLLVGLLLGHWVTQRDGTSSGSAAAPAPQVIKVEGTTVPPAASGTDSADGSGGDAGSGGSSSSSKSKSKASTSDASDKATAPKDSVSVKNLDSKKAVDDAVKKGKPISTGTGKLPPKDDKAPGGGSDFEEIG
jgi:hypothetical protein